MDFFGGQRKRGEMPHEISVVGPPLREIGDCNGQSRPRNVLLKQEVQERAVAGNTAATQLRYLIAWAPKDADAHLELGRVLAEQQQWEEAVTVLSAATSLKTDLAEAHYRLSLALRALGRISEAEEELRLARKLDPSLKLLE